MILEVNFGGKSIKVELPAKLQVGIVRDLQKLHHEYCKNRPDENIDFDAYLKIVANQQHPEVPPNDSDITDDIDLELALLGEMIKRKDRIIDELLQTISKIK